MSSVKDVRIRHPKVFEVSKGEKVLVPIENTARGKAYNEITTSDIVSSNITRSVITAGPAGEALTQAVGALGIFTALLEDEGPLKGASEDIKNRTKQLIEDTKKLVAEINAMVGAGLEEKEEAEDVKKVKVEKK